MKKLFVLAIMAVVLSATSSMAGGICIPAGGNNPEGAYIGVFFPRTSFRGDIQGLDSGDGAGIRLGFENKERTAASELATFKSWHDAGPGQRMALTGRTWNFRLSLPVSDIVSPYGFAGLGQYILETPSTVYRNAFGLNGYQVGGGLDMHLSKNLSLNFGYTKTRMRFDTGTPGDITLRTRAISYDIGLAVHF